MALNASTKIFSTTSAVYIEEAVACFHFCQIPSEVHMSTLHLCKTEMATYQSQVYEVCSQFLVVEEELSAVWDIDVVHVV